MRREFAARAVVEAPPEAVFDFVEDYRNVPRVLEGVSRWDPTGPPGGKGARYEVEMRTLGFPLSAVLVLDLWDRPRTIGWCSESGFIAQQGRWTFRPHPKGTEVELKIAYEPPGAAVGNLIAGQVEGLVRRRLERALGALRRELERG